MLAVNAIEAGLTQLNPIVTGVGVPVGVGVAVEDVPGCWIVKVSCALRGLISSEARMKWRPACNLGRWIPAGVVKRGCAIKCKPYGASWNKVAAMQVDRLSPGHIGAAAE